MQQVRRGHPFLRHGDVFEGSRFPDDFEDLQSRLRTGVPLNQAMHDYGLSSVIGSEVTDTRGNRMNPEQRKNAYHLVKWQRRIKIMTTKEKTLAFGFRYMDTQNQTLGYDWQVAQSAALIYRRAVKEGILRGRLTEFVTAGSLYVAARQHGVAKHLAKHASLLGYNKKDVGRSVMAIENALRLKPQNASVESRISQICGKIEGSSQLQVSAMKIMHDVNTIDPRFHSGKDPMGLGAAAIYIAYRNNPTLVNEILSQRALAAKSEMTQMTIRSRYQNMKRILDSRKQ